jgi:hypothetical protein
MKIKELESIFKSSAKSADKLQGFVPDMHIERAEKAYEAQQQRRAKHGYKTLYSKEFDERGIVVISNFMRDMTGFVEEIEKYPIAENKNEHNLVFDETGRKKFDTRWYSDIADLYYIVKDCHALPTLDPQFKQNTFVQRLQNSPDNNDVQKVLHMDTFFPTVKFWFFPQDVTIKDGPFCYVAGSNILTDRRKRWMRKQWEDIIDGKVDPRRTYGHAEGSLRVFDKELIEMGFDPECRAYPVKANTLVIANTFGFHARGEVSNTVIRQAIHGSIRLSQPFNV